MTTSTLRHDHVAPVYGTPIRPTRIFTSGATRREDIQRRARIWFNKRKLRQQARLFMDFMSSPREVTLRYTTSS